MKKINAIIEKANDGGIAIYSDDVKGSFGYGLTEKEAKDDFTSVLDEQAEYYKEKHDVYPEWYIGGYEINYFYDLSAFFAIFPFLNASKFAKEVGMNASVMRKYKGKIVAASDKQKEIIQSKYDDLLEKMKTVRFI